MEFKTSLTLLSFLQILISKRVLTTTSFNSCSGPWNTTQNSSTTDEKCDITRTDSKKDFNIKISDAIPVLTLQCNISALNNTTNVHWSKDGKVIAKGIKPVAGKYAVRYVTRSDNGTCSRELYVVEIIVAAGDDSGNYECGCDAGNGSKSLGFNVTAGEETSNKNLVGGVITVLTYIFTGCFHIGAVITLVVIGIQTRAGCPSRRVCRPARLIIVIVGELVFTGLAIAVPVLQLIKIIPPCCETDLFLKMIGIGVLLFILGLIIIIIAIVLYRRLKEERKRTRRSSSAISTPGRPESTQATAGERRLSTQEAVVHQELLESILDLTRQHSVLEANERPPPTAPSNSTLASVDVTDGLPPAPPANHEPLPGQVCCVCCDNPAQICFPQCGHANLCYDCAVQIIRGRGLCPMCNVAVNTLSILYT